MFLEWASFEVFSNTFLTSGTKNPYLYPKYFFEINQKFC